MNNRRVTNIILLVLLVFNVGFVGTWWIGHWRAHHRHKMYEHYMQEHESKGSMFLIKKLDLNQDQQNQLDALRKEHFNKIEQLETAVARNEKNIMAALMLNPMDSVKANACADSIGMLKASMQKELFRHFSAIRKICTPEQSKKFDEMVMEMSKEFPHHFDGHHGEEMHHDSM